MKTIQDLLQKGRSLLRDGLSPSLDAKTLLANALGVSEAFLYAHPEQRVPAARAQKFFRMVEKRRAGMPLAYILGEREFWSLRFAVSSGVLIPRPETECLVEEVIQLASGPPLLIADIGTGAGNIAISLARELPKARIVATDISSEALRTARRNARTHGAASSITFRKGDLFTPLRRMGLEASCDIICSNPPYVSEDEWESLSAEIRDHEPKEALVAGRTGLEVIERLVAQAPDYLKPGGHLCVEIGASQKDAVLALFTAVWDSPVCRSDLSGLPRVVTARLR